MDFQDTSTKGNEFGDRRLSRTELLRGLENRSPVAAREFHLLYSARISRLVWRLLGTDCEHDDVVQQVFVNVLGSLHRIIDPGALDSWVTSVTFKTVRYEIRKRKVRRIFFGKTCMEEDETDTYQDSRSPFKQSHIKKFYQILDGLPANDRIILVLKYLENYTIEQVAAAGNYSRSTAKRRLSKAKERFAKKALRDFSLISLAEECHAS